MDFRRAMPGDAEAILRFWKDCGASISTTDDMESVRRVAASPAAVFLLAVEERAIVGSLIGAFDGWRGNMYRLVVHPGRRRQGIARRMVREVEKAFSEWGVRRVTALVEVDRPSAAEFWSAVGYPRDDHIVRHVGTLVHP
jgi:ribosomal protein S18 acetylase RimI-like enzyme